MKNDYKLHSIDDIIQQIESLPSINAIDLDHENYESLRIELNSKINSIKSLKNRNNLLKSYLNLINLKIGNKFKIQKNLPSNKNTELYQQFAILKINLAKLKNLDDSRKLKLKKLLESTNI